MLNHAIYSQKIVAIDADIHRYLIDAHDPRMNFGANLTSRPVAMHRACAEIIARSEKHDPPGPIVHVEDDPPIVLFDAYDVPVRFFTVRPRSPVAPRH